MANKTEIEDRARTIFSSDGKTSDPRLEGISGTTAWNKALSIAAEELRLEDEAKALADAKARADINPVAAQPAAQPEESYEPCPRWFPPAVWLTFFLVALVIGAFLGAWGANKFHREAPASSYEAAYRPAAQRRLNEIARADARFRAAQACIDLRRVAKEQKACEIQ